MVALLQTEVEPVIAPAAFGAGLIVIAFVASVPELQELEGVTEMLPAVPPIVTVIEMVPCPAVIVLPVGTVQV